jgi:hypothetical protein
MVVREDEPVAEGIERGEVAARQKPELRPIIGAGACPGDRIRESTLGTPLPPGIEQAAVHEPHILRIRFVDRPRPLHGEVLVADEPQRAVRSDSTVAAAGAGVRRQHHTRRGEGVQDRSTEPEHAEILARCRALSFRLHLQEADIPAPDAADQSCATEDGNRKELRCQADAA